MGKTGRDGQEIGGDGAYNVPSVSSGLSGTAGMMSPFTVLPLHRDCFTVGVSQLDQSSSSNWSKVSGVQEKCFRCFVTAAAGAAGSVALDEAARCCCCRRYCSAIKSCVTCPVASNEIPKSKLCGIGLGILYIF